MRLFAQLRFVNAARDLQSFSVICDRDVLVIQLGRRGGHLSD